MPAPLTSLAVCGLVLLLFAALRTGAARLGNPAWANPIVLAALLLGSGVIASGMPVKTFEAASAPLRWMLGPAIVALALLVDRARPLLRGRGRAVLLAVLLGSAVGMASALAMAMALGLAPQLRAAVAVKSISGPFIYAILRSESGPVALAAALSVLTGTIGAVCLPPVYRLAGLEAERAARALGLGVSAHLVGSEYALRRDPEQGGLAIIGLVLAGLMASLVLPPVWRALIGG
ncbi:MAG: LrgB family protein [Polymorphobacter sp.]|uniref:LrgB family protein n=1 Tax=Polymorphobacter sp. TaxID=1909290 RepID=UPI003A85ADA2